jgi:hypothetical protein
MGYIGAGITRFNTADDLTVTGDAQIDTTTLVVDSTNNRVGVGTASPATALDVTGTVTADGLTVDGGANALTRTSSGAEVDALELRNNATATNTATTLKFANSTAAGSNSGSTELVAIRTGTNTGDFVVRVADSSPTMQERLRIDSSGNVGIGTAAPTEDLHIKGQDGAHADVIIQAYTGYNSGLNFNDNAGMAGRVYYNHSSNFMAFDTNGSEAARIDSSGNLLVSTTDTNPTNDSEDTFAFVVNKANHQVRVRSHDLSSLRMNRTGTDGEITQFYKNGSQVGSIGSFNGNAYYAGTGCGLRPRTGDISPTNASGSTNDGGVDLGTSSNRFQNIWLSGGAYLGGTSSANHLDDYEEGEFTPAIWEGTSAISDAAYNTSFTRGKYIKIGRMVMITMSLRLTSKGTPTGSSNFRIGGFPFTTTNDVRNRSAFATYDHDATGIDTNGNTTGTLHAFISNGVNYLGFRVSDPSQAVAETLTYDDLGNDTYLQLTGTIVVD